VVERESSLGGKLKNLEGFYSSQREAMIKAVEKAENIEILTSAEVAGVEGKIGDFRVRIKRGTKEILRTFGAIVLATGYKTEIVSKDFPLKPSINIIPPERLTQLLQAPTPETKPETIGFIFDLSDENSRFPTLATLNSALAVKKRWGSEVYVLCKNVKVDSEGVEKLYREAREQGVVFLKFDEKPRISADDGRVKIEVKDILVGQEVTLTCNLVVAEEKFLPTEGTEGLSSLLKIRTDSQGFYQEENVHLYPVSSERKGIYFSGNCRGDLDIGRVLTDISSTVARIRELLSPGEIVAEMDRVKVDPQKCVACLTCIRVCPHNAVQLVQIDSEKVAAEVSPLACDRCGICAAICPAKAIKFEGYSDDQILAQIEAIGAS
jgi:heterodisulfide reductase subunit A-like polyferredoxin